MFEVREGEVLLQFDPEKMPGDAHLVFIGRVHSPWRSKADCPKNMNAARESGQTGSVEIDEDYRAGLDGLAGATHVILLTWFDRSPRNLIVQRPRHAPDTKGVFALRSPVRPNPIGLHVARLTGVDQERGVLSLDAIDAIDGTPVIDVKPYYPSVDAFPDARTGKSDS